MFSFQGIVGRGNERGKRLGFPTANIPLLQQVPEGIYLSRVRHDGMTHNALTFIGSAKTYGETNYQSETHILNFDRDLYGQNLSITLLKKIRDNEAFTTEYALIQQMEIDKKEAEEYFKSINTTYAN